MKKIEFLHVECENYCGYTDLVGLDFKEGKITMIVGKNGVGKSTLFSIIPFTLYGMTQTGLRGEKAINRKAKRNCRTHVTFKINDDIYTCDRYLKYTKMGSSAVILTKNGKQYKNGNNEVVEEIERLIMPRQLFFNTVLFGQKVTTFFTDLTDAEQKNIFRKILDLEIYTEYQKIASEKIKLCDETIQNETHSLDTLDQLIKEFEKQIEQLEKDKIEFYEKKDHDIKKHRTFIQILRDEISTLESKIKDYNGEFIEHNLKEKDKLINSISEQINILKEKATSFFNLISEKKENGIKAIKSQYSIIIQTEVGNINSKKYDISEGASAKIKKRRSSIRLIEQEISQCDIKRAELETYKKLIEDEIDKYNKLLNVSEGAVCPVCLRPMGKEHNGKLVEKLEEYKNKIPPIESEIKNLIEKISELTTQIQSLNKDIENIEVKKSNDIKELENIIGEKKENISKEMNKAIRELEVAAETKMSEAKSKYIDQKESLEVDLEKEKRSYEKLNVLKKELDELLNSKTEKENNINKIESIISEIEKNEFDSSMITENSEKIKSCREKIKDTKENIKVLENQKRVYEFWKVGFSSSGIPSMLIDEAIPFMNKRVNEYLDVISNGRYMVSFDTLQETKSGEFRDKFNIRFYDNETHADGRELLSGGQTKIVDVATILTLADLQDYLHGVSINIMLFDEIFDALDDDNIQNVCNVLRQLIKDKNIIIISHRHIDQIEADEILKL